MEIKDERRKIPDRLHAVEAPLQEAKRVLHDATTAIDVLVKERRSHEKDLEAHEDRVEKLKERAAQLKTNQEKQVLDELDQKLTQELVELETQQRDRAAHVDKSLLDRYTKLKAARKDHALASVQGGICSGCRLQIPPQLIAEVKRSQDLHACPYCHLMLYWEGEVSTDQKPPQNQAKPSDLEVGESV